MGKYRELGREVLIENGKPYSTGYNHIKCIHPNTSIMDEKTKMKSREKKAQGIPHWTKADTDQTTYHSSKIDRHERCNGNRPCVYKGTQKSEDSEHDQNVDVNLNSPPGDLHMGRGHAHSPPN
jgi:hypothetical protein